MNPAQANKTLSVELSEYRELYFSEAQQQLERLGVALRRLEQTPADREALEDAFREAHTLKGMSATMGYDGMIASAHALEDLLQNVRGRATGATRSNMFFLFRAFEHLDQTLAHVRASETLSAGETARAQTTPAAKDLAGGEVTTTVRVGLEPLDRLGDLALRLLVKALPQPDDSPGADLGLASALTDLLDATRHLRLARLGEVFNRYPRMLNDLARVQGKEIRIEIEGAEVEVGRAMLEEVNEPLLHLLRNAVAHGIEPLAGRLRADKDPCGVVRIQAWRDGEVFYLQVSDDGRGLDATDILKAAQAQGFISDAERRTLSEREAFELITRPGFTLARTVTSVVGRGVGMDVVNARVEALRGTLAIRSKPGFGTEFTLRLPRTSGPIEVDLVRVGSQVAAIRTSGIESRMTITHDPLARKCSGEIDLPFQSYLVLNLAAALPRWPQRMREPEHCVILLLSSPAQVALRVDEYLGMALWRRPPDGAAPLVPLLDLEEILPAE